MENSCNDCAWSLFWLKSLTSVEAKFIAGGWYRLARQCDILWWCVVIIRTVHTSLHTSHLRLKGSRPNASVGPIGPQEENMSLALCRLSRLDVSCSDGRQPQEPRQHWNVTQQKCPCSQSGRFPTLEERSDLLWFYSVSLGEPFSIFPRWRIYVFSYESEKKQRLFS